MRAGPGGALAGPGVRRRSTTGDGGKVRWRGPAAHGFQTPTTLTMHCFYAAARGRPTPAREIAELAWLGIPSDERAAPALAQVLQRLN